MGCPEYNENYNGVKCPTIKTIESLGIEGHDHTFGILKQKYCFTDFTTCPQYKTLNKK